MRRLPNGTPVELTIKHQQCSGKAVYLYKNGSNEFLVLNTDLTARRVILNADHVRQQSHRRRSVESAWRLFVTLSSQKMAFSAYLSCL